MPDWLPAAEAVPQPDADPGFFLATGLATRGHTGFAGCADTASDS